MLNSGNQKVLVTGGAGFIGSHLVRRLIKEGYSVAVLTKPSTDLSRLKDVLDKIDILQDDLSDQERLKHLLTELSPSGVFHCAASNIRSGVSAPEDELIKVNFEGTVHLLKALEEVDYQFFVYCGSFLEYGLKGEPLKESDICKPVEIYALTKLAATLYCQSVARQSGKPIIIFRIFTPYGPQMEAGRLVYEVIERALKNDEIVMTGKTVTRDFIFIDDLVEVFFRAMSQAEKQKGEIFNLGSGRAITLEDFVGRVLAVTGSKSGVKWGEAKSVNYDSDLWQANIEKLKSAFAWQPASSLDFGIKAMVNWFKTSL